MPNGGFFVFNVGTLLKYYIFTVAAFLVLFLCHSTGWTAGLISGQDDLTKKRSLYDAVKQGKRSKAKELIQAGIGLQYRTARGESPLHVMANRFQLDLIKPALDAGADKNALNSKGWSPLFEAVTGGSLGAVLDLLEAGADPNLRDEWGQTALMLACGLLQDEMAEALIGAGADVNTIDKSNSSALVYALRYGEDLTLVTDVWVDCHYRVFSPIGISSFGPELYKLDAYAHNRAEVIRLLMEAGARSDWTSKKGETVFQLARKTEGFLPLAFIKEEAMQFPSPSLADLVLQGDLEKVKTEIAAAKAEAEVLVAFLAAAGKGDAETVRLLFPVLTSKGSRKTALRDGSLLAAYEGRLETMMAISELGARFNWGAEPEIELTPFHVAVFRGHLDTTKYLVDSIKDLGAFDIPILTAASRGFVDVVGFLSEAAKEKLRILCLVKEKPVQLVREASLHALTVLGFEINWASPRLVGGAPPSSFGRIALGRTGEKIQLIFNPLDDQRTQLVVFSTGSSTVFSKDPRSKVLAEIDAYLDQAR